MTLFNHQAQNRLKRDAPLATRMRPRSFEEFIGQEHIVGLNKALRKSIEANQTPSLILWGPPGSGKTTLANLIAKVTKNHFSSISAVESGVADLRRIVTESKDRLGMNNQRTMLFIDEIHRFNKSQQDVILPHVEDGTIVLIGATTENPSFEVISPLLSRARVFTLEAIQENQMQKIITNATKDIDRGIGSQRPKLDKDSMEFLIALSNGDARIALNALELASISTEPDKSGIRIITKSKIEDVMQNRSQIYDKTGDNHYDTISAFIKSIRASDPDASIYYLARMIEAGEDPMFIARRLVILASEDVGLANPQALSIAVATQQAVHFVGMPEGRIPLAEATIYLASSPKSNSANAAIDEAIQDVKRIPVESIPLHLRNATSDLTKNLGYGEGYKYAHKYPDNFIRTQNMPKSLKNKRYYQPSDQGDEIEASKRLLKWWGKESR